MTENIGDTLHILLVEDHDMLRRSIAATVSEAGFRITQATTGAQALSLLREGLRPQLLLSDIRMPGEINGLELARVSRTIVPEIAVVLQTGYTDLTVHEFRVLHKPYDPDELMICIRETLSGSR